MSMSLESFRYRIYEYFMVNMEPRIFLLAAARVAFESKKVAFSNPAS